MKTVFFELTMNAIMGMVVGKRYYGENVFEVENAQRFWEIVEETMRLSTSNIGDYLPVVRCLGVGGVEKQLVELQKKRDEFMQEMVEECKRRFASYGSNEAVKTMIELLLHLQEREPEYYTDSFIRSLMQVILIAGTDTSSVTMEWTLSLLLNNPHVLKKVQIEIDLHIGHDHLIEESDIANLPYLRSIINETLRLYPAGPLLVPHESSHPCTIGGYSIPAGTMLLVNAWALHNDPKYWEGVKEFRPERFEGLMGNRDGFKFFPFGSGRRGCPGEALAVRIIGFALGSLIQCFD